MCKTQKVLHVWKVAIYQLPSSVCVIHSSLRGALPLNCIGTLGQEKSLSHSHIHTPTHPHPHCQQDCILTEALYCLDRQTLSLSHCLGPVTPRVLLASTLSIIFSAGNHFQCSVLLVSVHQHLVWPKAKSTSFYQFERVLQRGIGLQFPLWKSTCSTYINTNPHILYQMEGVGQECLTWQTTTFLRNAIRMWPASFYICSIIWHFMKSSIFDHLLMTGGWKSTGWVQD